jgi:hypothetical protein
LHRSFTQVVLASVYAALGSYSVINVAYALLFKQSRFF